MSEEIELEEAASSTQEMDILTAWLTKSNPRVPIVIQGESGAKVLGFLRFVQAKGKIRIGRRENAEVREGYCCGIELVIRKDMFGEYKKHKVKSTEKYYHLRIQMLDPDRLQLLAERLRIMAENLRLKTVLEQMGAKPKSTGKAEAKQKAEEDFELERE